MKKYGGSGTTVMAGQMWRGSLWTSTKGRDEIGKSSAENRLWVEMNLKFRKKRVSGLRGRLTRTS